MSRSLQLPLVCGTLAADLHLLSRCTSQDCCSWGGGALETRRRALPAPTCQQVALFASCATAAGQAGCDLWAHQRLQLGRQRSFVLLSQPRRLFARLMLAQRILQAAVLHWLDLSAYGLVAAQELWQDTRQSIGTHFGPDIPLVLVV